MNLELKFFIMYFVLSFFICSMLSLLSMNLTQKNPDKEKVTVYECGFNPFHNPGEPFSMSFFIMAMLFLVFDLEVSLLFPWSSNSNIMGFNSQLMVLFFILILMIGLMYEWSKGGLEWE